jgi:hypothetical protein
MMRKITRQELIDYIVKHGFDSLKNQIKENFPALCPDCALTLRPIFYHDPEEKRIRMAIVCEHIADALIEHDQKNAEIEPVK